MRKLPVVVFSVLLVSSLWIGSHALVFNLTHEVFPSETKTAEPMPSPVVAPLTVMRTEAPEMRTLVANEAMSQLAAENERLRQRIAELEQSRPTTQGELAVILGVREADLVHLLDRSHLLPDAATLAEAVRVSGAQSAFQALKAEQQLYRDFAMFKANHPVTTDRATWHSTTWTPYYSASIEQICNRLYQLNLPSQVVEPFRSRLVEGI